MKYKIYNNITGERDMTAEEITAYNNGKPNASEKLQDIRDIRNRRLADTDWLVTSNKISEAETTWRENLRNIPQYYSEANYDDLLARDEQGNLTHTVWEKP